MIIRRRHTANFTTIGNALFDDERLSLDEIGLLSWLLSRPNDWEIRRPALRRRHRIGAKRLGAEGLSRIIHNLMKTGWCRAEKTRLSNGTFSVIYEIRDEPGEEMSEADVIKALSLVSSEADEDTDEEGMDPAPPEEPPPPSPVLASQLRPGIPGPVIKDLPNTESLNTDSTKATVLWRDLRAIWPSGDMVSASHCEQLFAALSRDDRRRAVDGVSQYLANCRAKNRKLCDLSKYLKEKRFVEIKPIVTGFQAPPNSPQEGRWTSYWLATGKNFALAKAREQWKQGRAAWVESEWPPPLPNDTPLPLPDTPRKTG